MNELRLPILAIDRLRMTADGEGVTTLVCSMGCPLRCRLCINPFSWDGTKPVMALTLDELYEKVRIDNLYFLSTGGGLTFGGGEPLLHSEFLKAFMEKYQSTGWIFNIESSLSVEPEHLKKVMPYIRDYIIDTKDMDPERYRKYTGGDFSLFYENLMLLKETVGPERIKVRVPRIPVLHKGEEEKENAGKLEKLGFTQIEIFPYVDPLGRKEISENARKNRDQLFE